MACAPTYGVYTALEVLTDALAISEALRQKNTRLVWSTVAIFATKRGITALLEVVWVSIVIVITITFRPSSHCLTHGIGSALNASAYITATSFPFR